jgi:hypothetical protein
MNTIKVLRFGVLAVAIGFLAACGGGGAKDPAGVAEAFLNAMENGDYDKAKKYASKDSQEALDGMAEMGKMGDMGEAMGGEKPEPKEIKVGEVTESEDGNTATVAYTADGVAQTLSMVKEDGDWKAVFSKSGMDMMDEGMDTMDDMDIDGTLDSLNEVIDDATEMIEGATN